MVIFVLGSSSAYAEQVTLLLVRHGETDWNVEGRVQGQTDIPLNEKGLEQARKVAELFAAHHSDLQAVYTSDLQRAYDTGLMTAEILGLPITSSKGLREIYYGVLEGMLIQDREVLYKEQKEQLKQLYPNRKDYWKYTPIEGAETDAEMIARMRKELKMIAQRHSGHKIAVFSHGRAIRGFIADIQDREIEDLSLPNCGVIEVIYDVDHELFSVKNIEEVSTVFSHKSSDVPNS